MCSKPRYQLRYGTYYPQLASIFKLSRSAEDAGTTSTGNLDQLNHNSNNSLHSHKSYGSILIHANRQYYTR